METIRQFWEASGAYALFTDHAHRWQILGMLLISGLLIYLAVSKKYEPLLLLPIAFGMLLTNLPGAELFHFDFFLGDEVDFGAIFLGGGLLDFLYLGVKLGIYPCLIFFGIGAMTDFTPLLANPKCLFIGAGAQAGVFFAFSAAVLSGIFTPEEAASIAMIGGADGPTAIQLTRVLSPGLLSAIAVAAYSYMALIPVIQPPLMRLLTTDKERKIRMTLTREVTFRERLYFPIAVTLLTGLFVPAALSLVGSLMLGNLLAVSGVTDRLAETVKNELLNIVTVLLGISVGATATAENFLTGRTLLILLFGITAFLVSTVGGILTAKLLCVLTKGRINPLIGSAGVSAVPMAARVSHTLGREADPSNFLLMHAMGTNVAGVIGSAVVAGIFLGRFA